MKDFAGKICFISGGASGAEGCRGEEGGVPADRKGERRLLAHDPDHGELGELGEEDTRGKPSENGDHSNVQRFPGEDAGNIALVHAEDIVQSELNNIFS